MVDLKTLTPAQFENLTLDLLKLLGLKNCIWRTPGRDGGRDIQGEFNLEDFSGFSRKENWYIECKRYSETVSWPIVWEKIAFAESNRAEILLFVTSSTLSPQAIDEVAKWNNSGRSTIVRFWNGQDFIERVKLFPQLLVKYGLSSNPVNDSAISILPLTLILAKYANTGAALIEFNKSLDRIYLAIHALSELISARIQEVEETGKTSIVCFDSPKDDYTWINNNNLLEAARLDRYTIRAILSLLYVHSKSPDLIINENNGKLTINYDLLVPAALLNDLNIIAFWGGAILSFDETLRAFEIQNE